MTHPHHGPRRVEVVWVAGLIVALGAGVATAHGLYEVATAAGTPQALAWLYPLITDGLALVAYAATTRLANSGRRYAWSVVVTAAALSGLTQASYLADGVATAPPPLRFAIGAWPALAAAIVAHLLYLLSEGHNPAQGTPQATPTHDSEPRGVAPTQVITPPVRTGPQPLPTALSNPTQTALIPATDPPQPTPVVRRLNTPVNAAPPVEHPVVRPVEHPPADHHPVTGRAAVTPAADRALTLARDHAARHGQLPTVTELVTLARVARGTAAAALKTLRAPIPGQAAGKPATNTRSHP
jgi:hypothetical protein